MVYANFSKSPRILFMIAMHLLAFGAIFHFSWSAVAIFALMYWVTACLGITFGFHRMLSHRTFKTPKWVERFFAFCGTLAVQGTIKTWVAHHRMHHANTDTPLDPHNARKGFWHSHLTWMFIDHEVFDDEKRINRFARDITSDPWLNFLSIPIVMIGIQALLGVAFYFIGGWPWVFWGIFLRLVAVYHITWFVNSATHKWGYRNFESEDLSTNNWWVGILAWGEGWHNNHHTYQDSCKSGYRWWEIDMTYWIIKALSYLGLTYDLKIPEEMIYSKDKDSIIREPEVTPAHHGATGK